MNVTVFELQQSECWLLGLDVPRVSPFKVEVVTTSQNRPPDAADVLLGPVNSEFVEAFECEELLLWG